MPDRLPPQNVEAEMGVICGVVLDNGMLPDVVRVLPTPEPFYRDVHQVIWRVILDFYAAGSPVDLISIHEELLRRDQWKSVGGDDYIGEIMHSVAHPANTVYYADIVKQKAATRRTIEVAETLLREAYSDRFPADELLGRADEHLRLVSVANQSGSTVRVASLVQSVIDRYERRRGGEVVGIPSGFAEFDEKTDGFQAQDLIVIAGRPSMGKTSLATNICEYLSCELKIPTLFVSLEMGEMDLAQRVIVSRGRIDGHKIRTGKDLDRAEEAGMARAVAEIDAAPLYLVERPARGHLQIISEIRSAHRRDKIALVAIDYLQQMLVGDSRGEREDIVIGRIVAAFKHLARELNIPVILLSQLNRNLESREDKRPRMNDLRGSGNIEQDADMILLVHRPEYYDPGDSPGLAEMIIAKFRNGETCTVQLSFIKKSMRFENYFPEPAAVNGRPEF